MSEHNAAACTDILKHRRRYSEVSRSVVVAADIRFLTRAVAAECRREDTSVRTTEGLSEIRERSWPGGRGMEQQNEFVTFTPS